MSAGVAPRLEMIADEHGVEADRLWLELSESALLAMQERVTALVPNAVFVSSTAAHGLDPLQRAFIDLVGPRARDEEVLSWLGSSSS